MAASGAASHSRGNSVSPNLERRCSVNNPMFFTNRLYRVFFMLQGLMHVLWRRRRRRCSFRGHAISSQNAKCPWNICAGPRARLLCALHCGDGGGVLCVCVRLWSTTYTGHRMPVTHMCRCVFMRCHMFSVALLDAWIACGQGACAPVKGTRAY